MDTQNVVYDGLLLSKKKAWNCDRHRHCHHPTLPEGRMGTKHKTGQRKDRRKYKFGGRFFWSHQNKAIIFKIQREVGSSWWFLSSFLSFPLPTATHDFRLATAEGLRPACALVNYMCLVLLLLFSLTPHKRKWLSFLQSLEQGLEHSRCSGNICEVNE